jgi:hypothetical protein
MALTKEEIVADLVWRYVEHVRSAEAEGQAVTLTEADCAELTGLLNLATRVPTVLDDSAERPALLAQSCRAGVRDRLEADLHAADSPRGTSTGLWQRLRSFGRTRMTAATAVPWVAAAVMGAALMTVGWWHRPQPVVQVTYVPRRVPVDAPDVDPIDERTAHALIPQMVRNEISTGQERSLMWHMLVCPGCYAQYHELKTLHPVAAAPPAQLASW